MAVTTSIDSPAAATNTTPLVRRRGTFGADKLWALAFVTPYVAIFVAFVIYPIGYGLWLGSDPASYRALFGDPVYPRTVVNTLLYLLFGVNLKLLLALLLSGFFMRKGWWTKFLLLVFMLPWAMPALSTHVLATLGIRNAFELGDPKLGMATVLTALPLLIPLVILLMRQLRRSEVTI